MRSIRMLAAVTGALVLGSACGDGNDPENQEPVANFTPSTTCTINVPCGFTDASEDSDGTIETYAWDFTGDGVPEPNTNVQDPTYTYTVAQTYQVTLTVTDNEGATGTRTLPVVVGPATPGNIPPTAGFNVSCDDVGHCTFTSTSADTPPGTIATYLWNFGDGSATSSDNPAIHEYAPVTAETEYTVTLTVTDDGGATAMATRAVTVAPPTAELCETVGNLVNCTLGLAQRSTVRLTLTSVSCELLGNKIAVAQPRRQNAYFNVCSKTALPEEYLITDATGAALVFEAGSQVVIEFTQGTEDPGDPALGSPAIRIDGSSPSWTLNIDDGGNPTGPGEPDFTDAVVAVTATAP
jgi:PKD repeat protein